MSVYTVHIGSSNVISLPKSLAVAIVIMVALLLSACGGNDLETLTGKDKAMAASPALQTMEARKSHGTAVDPHSSNVQAIVPTTIPEIDMESARKYLWVYLSKCITFAMSDIEGVQLDGIWYVRGKLASKHETGLWKILDNGREIEPYDQRAKNWLVTINGECAEENMQVMTTPTPVVTGATYASTAIWSILVGCVSELEKSKVHASDNPSNAEWIITTDEIFVEALGREAHFGVWSLSYTGVHVPKDNLAKAWYGYLYETPERPGCGPQYLVPINAALPALTPVPEPTNTPTIRNGSQAKNSVWAYLVPCFPEVGISEFAATYDDSNSNWVVLQTKESKASTWSVSEDGNITASNASAKADEAVVNGAGC